MPLILTLAPSIEPVSLAEAKAHFRVDGPEEDALINSLITAARLHIERMADIAMIEQNWSLYLDAWPRSGAVSLPIGPAAGIAAIRVYAAGDTHQTLDAALYAIDLASPRARVKRRAGGDWPPPGRSLNGIEIAFTAGYGAAAASVPQPLRQAVLLLAAHWHERREALSGAGELTAQPEIAQLVGPYRMARL